MSKRVCSVFSTNLYLRLGLTLRTGPQTGHGNPSKLSPGAHLHMSITWACFMKMHSLGQFQTSQSTETWPASLPLFSAWWQKLCSERYRDVSAEQVPRPSPRLPGCVCLPISIARIKYVLPGRQVWTWCCCTCCRGVCVCVCGFTHGAPIHDAHNAIRACNRSHQATSICDKAGHFA